MKQRVIVYIAGSEDRAEGLDSQKALEEGEYQADRLGLVSSRREFFDVQKALLSMISKGGGRIGRLISQVEGRDRLRSLIPPIHLSNPDASPNRKKLIAASNLAIAFGWESIRLNKTNSKEVIT